MYLQPIFMANWRGENTCRVSWLRIFNLFRNMEIWSVSVSTSEMLKPPWRFNICYLIISTSDVITRTFSHNFYLFSQFWLHPILITAFFLNKDFSTFFSFNSGNALLYLGDRHWYSTDCKNNKVAVKHWTSCLHGFQCISCRTSKYLLLGSKLF